MIYIKINSILYPAIIEGKIEDNEWDNRESKSITINDTYENINTLFSDGVAWSIIEKNFIPTYLKDDNDNFIFNEEGNPIPNIDEEGNFIYKKEEIEYDNSEFLYSW